MIKRTLYFGNPSYLKTKNEQMVVELQETDETTVVPIEDIGILLLDNPQITITHGLIAKLLHYNAAIITCNETHHPTGLMLNLDGNSLQSQKFQAQLESSVPLRKQLWQQTIIAKILNQAAHLKLQKAECHYLLNLSKTVSSGDEGNAEAKAAAYYWKRIFPGLEYFTRERFGMPPNNYLNYGYAILRAVVARSLVSSGLLPTLGIHHRNQYNAYCLADDIMEPYRPFVDMLVSKVFKESEYSVGLTPAIKKQLLTIPAMDVIMEKQKSPLMNAVQRTTASLSKCFDGSSRKILYPTLEK
jgi:CRISP-associated protein Cas1